MPVVVGTPGPVLGTPVTSSDGVVTVTPRLDLGAVLITVQFGSASVNARTVTVIRGDGSNVRGLDTIAAPSGVTAGIDAEVNLGLPATYTARAVAADGTTWTSTSATVTVQRPTNRAWLTCLSRPELSCLVTALDGGYPDWPLTGRVGKFGGLSSSYTTTGIGVPYWADGQAVVLTQTVAADRAFEALMMIQEPLLLRPDALQAQRRGDDYVTVLTATPSQPGVQPGYRVWTLGLSRNQRPPTAGSTVNIPGRSIATLAATYATIADLPSPPLKWLTG